MKALRFHGPRDVRVEEVEKPRLQEPEDVILRVTLTTICGTDLHPYRGSRRRRPGSPMGHECVGRIEEVGPLVGHVRSGDRVLVPAMACCGYCPNCTAGCPAQCLTEGAGGLRGAQAEYVRVPFAPYMVVPIPPDMSDEAALTLTDIFPTGYFACELAEVQAGESVAVFGAGPVGLFAMLSAKLLGAGRIFAVDNDRRRLELAARRGFQPIDFGADDPVQAIRRQTGGLGTDACLEAVGTDAVDRTGKRSPLAALRWCVESAKAGGRIGVVGLFSEDDLDFPIQALVDKNLTLRSGYGNHRLYLPKLIQILQQGLFDPMFVYTGDIGLEDLASGYERCDRHDELKLLVRVP